MLQALRGTSRRPGLPQEDHLLKVLHHILNDPAKEKRFIGGARKSLLYQRKAGEAIGEDDLDIITFVNICADDMPVIDFIRSCYGAFTPTGRSNFESNLKNVLAKPDTSND